MARSKKVEKRQDVPDSGTDFFSCPKGHRIPNEDGCTAIRCAVNAAHMAKVNASRNKALEGKRLMALAAAGDTAPLEEQRQKDDKDAQFGFAEARREFRHGKLNVPKGLVGKDADKWAEIEIQNAQVDAVAEQLWKLRYGNDDQRDSASRLFLAAGGHGPRDPREGSTAVIIINGAGPVPWVSRPPIGSTVVEALPNASQEKL